jgi:uncharacterized lipoprotein YmbA
MTKVTMTKATMKVKMRAAMRAAMTAFSMRPLAVKLALSGLAAGSLAACASVEPDRFYTLEASASGQTQPKAGAFSVALGPLTLPELVDRPQLVLRSAANRVTLLEHQRWAESLKSNLARVLASNLRTELGGVTVAAYGDNASRDAKYLVLVDVTRFDAEQDQAVTLEAVWSVRDVAGSVLQSGHANLREATQAGSVDALVAAHGRTLARVSAEIALSVRAAEGALN